MLSLNRFFVRGERMSDDNDELWLLCRLGSGPLAKDIVSRQDNECRHRQNKASERRVGERDLRVGKGPTGSLLIDEHLRSSHANFTLFVTALFAAIFLPHISGLDLDTSLRDRLRVVCEFNSFLTA